MAEIVHDNFGGTSATIDGRAPDTVNTPGNNWLVESSSTGDCVVDGSGGLQMPNGANDGASLDVGDGQVDVECEFNAGGSDNRMSMFAHCDTFSSAVDPTNGMGVNFRPGSNDMQMYRWVSGTKTAMGSASLTMSTSTTYKCEYVWRNSDQEFFVDDTSRLTETYGGLDARTSDHLVGLEHNLHTNGNARWYYLKVRDAAVVGPTVYNLMQTGVGI